MVLADWQSRAPLALTAAALVAMLVYHWRMLTVLAASAVIGATTMFYLRP